ncbi:MAG: hypothetical protein AAF416_22545 [Pseudomonadota bacterium]
MAAEGTPAEENREAASETMRAERPFVYPEMTSALIEFAFIGAESTRHRGYSEARFRAENPEPRGLAERAALETQIAQSDGRLAGMRSERAQTDLTISVQSEENVCPPHPVRRIAGISLLALSAVLIGPMPFVVGAGIYESLAIERVVEEPLWALAYGVAPLGAVVGLHGLRDIVTSDLWRRIMGLGINLSAIAAFAHWAWLFGPTFLSDVTAGFDAFAEAGASLSEWYFAHLLLECMAGAATYLAGVDLLTANARTVTEPNPRVAVLDAMIAGEEVRRTTLAAALDDLDDARARYETASSASADLAETRVEAIAKMIATHASDSALKAYAEIRAALCPTETGEKDA